MNGVVRSGYYATINVYNCRSDRRLDTKRKEVQNLGFR